MTETDNTRPDAPQPATTDDAVERAAQAIDPDAWDLPPSVFEQVYGAAVSWSEQHQEKRRAGSLDKARAALAAAGAGAEVDPNTPPGGWFTFGTHAGPGTAPEMEFYGTDADGDPLWERPVDRGGVDREALRSALAPALQAVEEEAARYGVSAGIGALSDAATDAVLAVLAARGDAATPTAALATVQVREMFASEAERCGFDGLAGFDRWLAEHEAQVLRAWGRSLLDRYPEDVFVPPSQDAYDRVHRARGATGVSLDALSADAMRRAARLAIQDAARIAAGEEPA